MSTMKSIGMEKAINENDALPSFNMHRSDRQRAKTPTRKTWNDENFFRTQLSHQRIEEFPSEREHIFSTFIWQLFSDVNPDDVEQLRRVDVKTMQDLLGCYLIHDTPEEFRSFLIKIYHLTDKTASNMTQLLYRWTRCHLDGITDHSNAFR